MSAWVPLIQAKSVLRSQVWVARDNSGISPHPTSPLYLEAASWGPEDEGGASERTQEPCRMTTEATALGSRCSHVCRGVSLLRAGACRISPSCYESLCVYVEGTGSAVILLSLSLPTQESKIQFLENISKHNRCRHGRKCQKALGVSASSRWSLAQISTVLTDELGKGSTLSLPFPPSYSASFLGANCCVSHQMQAHLPLLHVCL